MINKKTGIFSAILIAVLTLFVFVGCNKENPKETKYVFTVSATEGGTVGGTAGGEYAAKTEITVTATSDVGYGFVGWYEGETLIYKNASYTFEMPERNLAISAVFETLRKAELIVNATEGGTVGGTESGEYYVGTDITVTATPDDGYVFSGWYKGDSPVSKKSSYTFKMSENALTLTAKFENVDLWKGTTAPAFQGGSGTENDPYRIKNGAQLALLSKYCKENNTVFNDKYYVVVKSIDLNGLEWEPINKFYGSFDGNGYVVTNFIIKEISQQTYAGLFGMNYGEIKNLGVTDFTIDVTSPSRMDVGGLCGHNVEGTVTDCYAIGTVKATTTSKENVYVGGLCGYNQGVMPGCHAVADVTIQDDYVNAVIGGLCGAQSGVVKDCYASGNVSVEEISDSAAGNEIVLIYAGGLCGATYRDCRITDSYSSVTVKVNTSLTVTIYAGGLCGYVYQNCVIADCYAVGNVSSTVDVVTEWNNMVGLSSGGLFGYVYGFGEKGCKITDCFATGNVHSITTVTLISVSSSCGMRIDVGGLCGKVYGSSTDICTIANCYATGDVFSTTTVNIKSSSSSGSVYVKSGGLCGSINKNCTISDSYAIGSVTAVATAGTTTVDGTVDVGGLCGKSDGSIINCYRLDGQKLTAKSGNSDGTICEIGTAVTLSELQSEAFFSETLKWGKYVAEEDRAENPANVWVIVDNAHPKLYFQK